MKRVARSGMSLSGVWLSSACALSVLAGGVVPALGQAVPNLKDAVKKAGQEVKEAAKEAAKDAMGMKPEAKPEGKPEGKMDEKKAMNAATNIDLAAPLPTDPRLVTGTLDNGLSYIVVNHQNPPGRANMWIHVSSGSLNEKDNQRGIAHYLEHMAFNGTENFPAGTVVDFFQSMGLTFGQHQNAFTSFDQTTYQLAFPDTKPETIERGMRFFSDVAMRMTLAQKEVDEERQVIFEEKRTGLGAAQRIQDYVLERLIPGSLIGVRLPIGVDQTLSSVQRADFVDYYSRWYVPSNMTVIVVADADPKEMAGQISKAFAGGEKKPKPVDQEVGVKPYDSTRAIVAHDKELTTAELSITSVSGKRPPITTVGALREDLVRQIASSAYNRRLGAKLAKGGVSYTDSSAVAIPLFNTAMLKQASTEGKPENWKTMLSEMGTELQRARLHGFSQREIDDVKSEMIAGAERFVEQEKTLPARALTAAINNAVATGNTLMGAQNELAQYKALLPTITRDEVSKAFSEMFDTKNVTFVAQLPDSVPGGIPSESELVELGRKALDVQPTAETEAERPTVLMASKPVAGKVGEIKTHEATKVVTAMLDNGVTAHYRFMDYRKEQATIQITLAAGAIQETAADRGIAEVAGLAWGKPATSTLTSTNIRDIMTGKKVNVGGGVGMDTMTLSVSGNPNELEQGMQLAHLLLTDPKIEDAAFDQWKTETLQAIEKRAKDPQGAFTEALASTLYPASETRTQPLTAEQVNKLSVSAAQKWLKKTIASAPIEVTVVGDIAQDKAMELVSTYLGSISKREAMSASTLDTLRAIKRVKGPIVTKREITTQTPNAFVATGFYAADAENVADTRKLQMATRVLSTRFFKKVREAEQLAYSPSPAFRPGTIYPGFGFLALISPTDPSKTDRLLAASTELYQEFAKTGPTDEEMETAKKQLANNLDENMKEPGFWLGRTGAMVYRNIKLDDVMSENDFGQKLTAAEVKDAYNRYYKEDAVMQVVVRPAGNMAAPAEKMADKPAEKMAEPKTAK